MYRQVYGERHPAAPDVKEIASDVPPVSLSGLPVAAKTPGGGVRATKATVAATTIHSSKSAKPAVMAAKRPATPAAKKSEAAKHVAPKKKKTTERA
jgi:hypothetical protein